MSYTLRPRALFVAIALAYAGEASAINYDATGVIGGHSGPLLWNYPDSNTWVYLSPAFDTPQYKAVYNALNPAPTGFGNTATVGVAPLANNVQYGEYTVALRGAGKYSFSVLQPGTTYGAYNTAYDLMSILYVSPGGKTPFNPATPYANLVALSDDSTQFAANPDPLFYINGNATGCVTMTLVYFSWAGVSHASATIQVNGPGKVATSCAALGVLDAVTAENNRVARHAAAVIDANGSLISLFNNVSGNAQRSNAVSQTLPLLTGSSTLALQSALYGIDQSVGARMNDTQGGTLGERLGPEKNLWIKAVGSWADQSDHNGVEGFVGNSSGVVFGGDASVTAPLRIGAAVALAHSVASQSANFAPQSDSIDIYQLIGYGYYQVDARTVLDFQADIGTNRNFGMRGIPFDAVTASSRYDSTSMHTATSLARAFDVDATTVLSPYVRADYTSIHEDAYGESGANMLDLSVASRNYEQLLFGGGSRITHAFGDRFSLSADVGVDYNPLQRGVQIAASYAGALNDVFMTEGITPSRWQEHAGVGVSYRVKENLEVAARLDSVVSTGYLDRTVSAKLRWLF
jgi:outer membrane autotransporter protein